MARKPLGRGLVALLGDSEPISANSGPIEIGIDQIRPNAEQPRTRFLEESLDELADSIRSNGIVQPIIVREFEGGYQIVAGERRWRAAQKAGLHKVPVVLREVADESLLELALVENIQRSDLNPIEEARAYKNLIESLGLTQEAVAERVGKDRTVIATHLRLLKLPDDIVSMIEVGKISAGHGRALLMSDDANAQKALAREIIDKGLSVRETERIIKKKPSNPQTADTKGVTATKDPNVTAAESKLRRKLGTGVNISADGKGGGKIEIEYYSESDLDRIYQMLVAVK